MAADKCGAGTMLARFSIEERNCSLDIKHRCVCNTHLRSLKDLLHLMVNRNIHQNETSECAVLDSVGVKLS